MTEVYQSPRERRTAYFIVAVMVFALLWFAGKAGWLGGWLDDDVTEAPQVSPAEDITYQRGLVLPLMPLKELTVLFDGAAGSNLRSNGINWIMVRVPVWAPSPRRFEYDGVDLARLSGIVETAHAVGMGLTLAPVYWDGSALHGRPPVPVSPGLLGHYRSMLHDFADAAAESGADALLLDGLFGNTDVSAAEWVEVLEELRVRFPGRIEGRMDAGYTPPLYLNQLDAANITTAGDTATQPVGSMLGATLGAFPDKGLRLLMPEPDYYSSAGMPWLPVITRTGSDSLSLMYLSSPLLSLEYCRGFFIGGRAAFELLTAVPDSNAPLARALRAMAEARLRGMLEKRREVQTITQ